MGDGKYLLTIKRLGKANSINIYLTKRFRFHLHTYEYGGDLQCILDFGFLELVYWKEII